MKGAVKVKETNLHVKEVKEIVEEEKDIIELLREEGMLFDFDSI
jgi:hypothetical protein